MKRRYSPSMRLKRSTTPQTTRPERVSSTGPKALRAYRSVKTHRTLTAVFVVSLAALLLLVALGVSSSNLGIDKKDMRAAFWNLPDSFLEIDPKDFGVATETLAAFGGESQNSVAFGSASPWQLIVATTATSTTAERFSFDTRLSSTSSALQSFSEVLDKAISSEQAAVALIPGASVLSARPQVGETSIALSVGIKEGEISFRVDLIFFRREHILGTVAVKYRASESPTVSADKAASLLDAKIQEVLKMRSTE